MTLVTPIQKFNINGIFDNYDIRIKRDDLYPEYLGGNKARKIKEIGAYALSNGFDCIVTNGGVQSNHCRATAMFCAQNDIKCRLVLHSENMINNREGNYLLSELAGAKISFTPLSQLAKSMDEAMEDEIKCGFNPLYVWGGGHSLEGSLAYFEAFKELKVQCDDEKWYPDYIVFASGTGTTQAGIHVGCEDAGWNTEVIGISVAREKVRGEEVIMKSCEELRASLNLNKKNEVVFLDEYIGGGYEKHNSGILNIIKLMSKKGVYLDPTYTGKAFWGLSDLIYNGTIQKESKVLFWHTGGLFNLLTSNGLKL